jgi:hypothetical protein
MKDAAGKFLVLDAANGQHSEMKLLISTYGIDLPCNPRDSVGSTQPPLSRDIGLVADKDTETSVQYRLKFIGDEPAKDNESLLNTSKPWQWKLSNKGYIAKKRTLMTCNCLRKEISVRCTDIPLLYQSQYRN